MERNYLAVRLFTCKWLQTAVSFVQVGEVYGSNIDDLGPIFLLRFHLTTGRGMTVFRDWKERYRREMDGIMSRVNEINLENRGLSQAEKDVDP